MGGGRQASREPRGVNRISLGDFPDFPIELPELAEQRGIAATLGALDDKIESNRHVRMLLLALAQTQTILSSGTSSVRVGDVADVVKGLSYKGSGLVARGPAARPMINLANFATDGWMEPIGLKHYAGKHRDRHVVRAGELLVANTDLTQQRVVLGPLVARSARLRWRPLLSPHLRHQVAASSCLGLPGSCTGRSRCDPGGSRARRTRLGGRARGQNPERASRRPAARVDERADPGTGGAGSGRVGGLTAASLMRGLPPLP